MLLVLLLLLLRMLLLLMLLLLVLLLLLLSPTISQKLLAQHMRGRKRDDVALESKGSTWLPEAAKAGVAKATAVKAAAAKAAAAKSMTNEMFNLRLKANKKKEGESPEDGFGNEKAGKNIVVVYISEPWELN